MKAGVRLVSQWSFSGGGISWSAHVWHEETASPRRSQEHVHCLEHLASGPHAFQRLASHSGQGGRLCYHLHGRDTSTGLVGQLLRVAHNFADISVALFSKAAQQLLGQTDEDGQTQLAIAASQGNEAVVERLLTAGAAVDQESISLVNDDGPCTPLIIAAVQGHEAVAERLLAALSSRQARYRRPGTWKTYLGPWREAFGVSARDLEVAARVREERLHMSLRHWGRGGRARSAPPRVPGTHRRAQRARHARHPSDHPPRLTARRSLMGARAGITVTIPQGYCRPGL